MIQKRAKDVLRVAAKGVFTAADIFSPRMAGPRILIYHQIGAGLGRQMEVTQENFARQIDWVLDHGEILDLDSAIEQRGNPGADETYVLTFDDGYRDMYERAWPILQQKRLPFTLYLTTGPVESGQPLTPGGRADPLTWAQIEEMLASGLMTLGAHTNNHKDLRSISVDEVEAEIGESNELISDRTGVAPTHFAYPWGYWSRQADPVIRQAYTSAALGSGPPVVAATDTYLLNRVPVQLSDGMVFFKKKMRTGLRLEDRTRRRIVGYDGP
ncbi:MAG: polysaccharide deacetylase family protein [Acidimicrobiia bacterium]